MTLPPNFSDYMDDLVSTMIRDIGVQTVHTWGRYVIVVFVEDNAVHTWLLRDEFNDGVTITYLHEDASLATDEDVTAVVGMIKAAME